MEPEVIAARNDGVVLDHDHPWPGLVTFTEANYSFFFGREREVAELARLVRQETLTVFFGKSGLGKSSILRAGLTPLLRDSDFVPIYIRLNHAEAAPPLEDQVEVAIEKVLEQERVEAPKPVRAETLWEYFHKKESDWWDAENRLVKPILIFDQFEELMTLGQENLVRSERTANFLTELEDLIENRPPAALAARFKNERGLTEQFDHRRSSFRIILSLREDFLADLEGLRERLSPIMRNRFRLLPMNGEQALDVILKPGADLVEEDIAIKIVDLVSSSERSRLQSDITRAHLAKRAIEPALLSVVLQELNNRRIKAGQPKISAELVGTTNAAEIFHDFYLRGLQGMDDAVREFIEDSLLTSSGARNRIAEEDALTRTGISADILAKLIDRRIIQRETTGNIKWLELTHDTLADVVRSDRTEHRQERELKLAAARERETRLKLRRIQKLTVAFAILLIAALVAFLYARVKERSAKDAQRLAQQAQQATAQATDSLTAGILRKIEQNARIRVNEKLFLAKRLIDSVEEIRKAHGASHNLSMRHADLLATAALMLFDAGRIDEGGDYARQGQALILAMPTVPANSLVVSRVQLAFVLAQRFTWQTDEEETLAVLDRIEAQLRIAASREPEDQLAAQILKARLAWVRSDTLRSEFHLEAANSIAAAAIAEIEKALPSEASADNGSQTLLLQNLTQELLKLYLLRYRIALSAGSDLPRLEEIHAGVKAALQAAKARFQSAANDLWDYFEAKDFEVASSISELNKKTDEALGAIETAVARFHQLFLDDPQNLLWRFELGYALCRHSDIAPATRDQKLDRDLAVKLAATLRRDQSSEHFYFRLASLAGNNDPDANPAGFLTRVSLAEQRFGHRQDFEFFGVLAHIAALKSDIRNKLFPAAVQDAEAVLAGLDRLKFTEKDAASRLAWRLNIFSEILGAEGVDADALGRSRWTALNKVAQADAGQLLLVSKRADHLSAASYVLSMGGDQYRRDHQYREAIATFKQASGCALTAIRTGPDKQGDLQNYLYFQRYIVESYGDLGDGNGAMDTCRETGAELAALVKSEPKLAAVAPYVEALALSVDKARKSLAERSPKATPPIDSKLAAESKAFKDQAEEFKQQLNKDTSSKASNSRVDLQRLELDELEAGPKNYKRVKQQLGWADQPIYPSAWATLISKEFDEAASLITSKAGISESQIQRIRACPLSFYEQGRLIEAEYAEKNGDIYIVALVSAKGIAARLDGTSPPIHEVNSSVPLRLQTAEDTVAYLRFFCSYVRGDEGAFHIVESNDDLRWTKSAPAQTKAAVARLLRPLVVWRDPKISGAWQATATIQYSTALFHAQLKVPQGGTLEMSNDKPVANDLPLSPREYQKGNRSIRKRETLDISIVNPAETKDEGSKGYDEVEALLSFAELPKDKRPAHYLQLANEAAGLQLGISSAGGRGDNQTLAKLTDVITRVCTLISDAGNHKEATRWSGELVKVADRQLTEINSTDASYPKIKALFITAITVHSWHQLLAKDNAGALASTEAGRKVDPENLFVETNRAHALLFLGRTKEAEEIYRKYIGQKIRANSTKTWEETIREDFDAMEKNGLRHPDFESLRKLLESASNKS